MTSTLQTQSTPSNVALEYAVTHNLPKLAKWALEKPESEKPTNIENCLNLALSKLPNEDIISLLVSQLNSSKIEDTNVKESIKEAPKEAPKEESKKEESKEDAKKEEPKEEPKKEESKEDAKKEEPKEKYPQPLTIIKSGTYNINNNNLYGITGDITSLTLQILNNPIEALEELKKGKYSLEELNYQHKDRFMFTILHILCDTNTEGTIYEEILEYLLTETDIDINLLSTGGNNPFSVSLFAGSFNISDKICKLFLEHPKFNHSFKIHANNIVNHLIERHINKSIKKRNDNMIKLFLECPNMQYVQHPIITIIKKCFMNSDMHNLLEDILNSKIIKIDNYIVFNSFINNSKFSYLKETIEIIAQSKQVPLYLNNSYSCKYFFINIKNNNNKNILLEAYLKHFPEGIW
jgi:hypothetical protein